MRKSLLLSLAVLLISAGAVVSQSSCPADRAAQHGYDPFGEFHHVLAPVWHEAWPEKEYDALFAAGPRFAELFEKIAAMKPQFKSETRLAKFNQLREEFGALVEKFAEAARQKDKEAVYAIMPELHDGFEMTAATLLPVHYPEFEGVVITLNLIRESHLPTKNMDGILGSTKTLVARMERLNEETIPEELTDVKEGVLKDIEMVKATVAKLKECCDKEDLVKMSAYADELNRLLLKFATDYI
ncbi:MAG: hypothetical protein P1R58_01495 [bacterium]|nr:hypothetical protein [bacterium]